MKTEKIRLYATSIRALMRTIDELYGSNIFIVDMNQTANAYDLTIAKTNETQPIEAQWKKDLDTLNFFKNTLKLDSSKALELLKTFLTQGQTFCAENFSSLPFSCERLPSNSPKNIIVADADRIQTSTQMLLTIGAMLEPDYTVLIANEKTPLNSASELIQFPEFNEQAENVIRILSRKGHSINVIDTTRISQRPWEQHIDFCSHLGHTPVILASSEQWLSSNFHLYVRTLPQADLILSSITGGFQTLWQSEQLANQQLTRLLGFVDFARQRIHGFSKAKWCTILNKEYERNLGGMHAKQK